MEKQWFQQRLRQLGKTQRGLAKHMGLDPSRITEILNESRSIKIEEAVEIADYLETPLDDLVTKLGASIARGIRASSLVVGYVGAGETVLSIDDHAKGSGLYKIEAPQGEGGSVCVVVRGNSMAPRFKDGEHLGYSRDEGLDPAKCFGRECVVQTKDGRQLVKIVEPGNRAGEVTLVSVNATTPIEHNVAVEWVAPVTWVKLHSRP
ncbi:helix-turn-helix transcriptional regulator [Pelagibius litoralis]|uniref:Helix-turn-helix transcriptional regulator n=1 Tax=Pelagibius litoralis TaxID=374515 RepID=A0A967EZH3_9PROT|nr:helix-turn-helix domain-containing protein [Pelagibius litoralis]NIA70235.1 helix-turn-helix transcriptional regulator [Pelagibius litoralis]